MNIKWSKITNNLNDILTASTEGFDCIEMSIDYIMSLSDEQFLFYKNIVTKKNILCETCNSILPINVSVTEDGFNIYVWIDYLKKASRRASELGCKTFIWNNGKARLLPYEEDTGNAKEQIFQFIYMLSELLKYNNITLLIEPLGLPQTNYINTIEEAKELFDIINKDNFSSLISVNQLSQIRLKPNEFSKYGSIIKHVYCEDPTTCTNYNYEDIFKNLKAMKFSNVISLPSHSSQETLKYCKNLLSNS